MSILFSWKGPTTMIDFIFAAWLLVSLYMAWRRRWFHEAGEWMVSVALVFWRFGTGNGG